ncbi:MAG: sugar ABC transporter substrate-binding protein [Chloroflexota bacterium]|nr:MAG: sugar ABC transporter substrate-binding protein [Chloroflexota bacterium]
MSTVSIVVLLLAMLLAACSKPQEAVTPAPAASGEQAEVKEEFYSMIVFTKGAEYFNWCYAGALDAAKTIGDHITIELQGPAEWDASLEARALEQVISKKPNAIMVSSADEATLIPAIDKAVESGIPVIGFDSDSPASKRLSYVGTNNFDFGATGARAMGEFLNGKGDVAILMVPGMAALEERAQGFQDELARSFPDIKVVTTINDEGDVSKAESATTAALQANPNIVGIFSTHGYGGPGAAAAVRTLGRQGEVVVIASDYGGPVIELLKTGEILGTVIDDPYLIGYQAFMLAYAAAHPTTIPSQNPPFGHVPPIIFGGSSLLTGDDLKDPAILNLYENPPQFP